MERIIERLSELVSIPSVTGDEVAIRDRLAELLHDIGLTVEAFDADLDAIVEDPGFPGMEVPRTVLPVVCGTLNPDGPGTHPMLSGHIDVVPPGDPASWTSDPFTPRLSGGRLYGRGACDMKGGVVAILETIESVVEAGHRGPVSVVFVPSEEDGGSGTLAAIRRGTTADFVVIPEPTDLEIVTAHAGAITFRLVIPGKAAHAAARTEGVSALDGLQTIRAALTEDEARRNQAVSDHRMAEIGLPYPTIVGTVSGGVWASSVIDAIEITGRYGVKLDQGVADAAADLEHCLRSIWEADPFLRDFAMDFEVFGAAFDSCAIPDGHELPVTLAESVRAVTGRRVAPKGLPAGTDMRLFVNEADIPAVLFGPGRLAVAHAADEYVDIEDVSTCASILTHWVTTLDADQS